MLPTPYGWSLGDLAVFGDHTLRMPIAALAGVAAVLSGVMLWRGGREAGMPGCGPRSGCAAVTRSRWARLGPVPVAALGMLLYGVLAGAAGLGCLGVPAEGVVMAAAVMEAG